MASTYLIINCNRHQYTHCFMFMKLILKSALGQDRLAASSIGCNRDPAEGDFRKDSNGHFVQR